MTRVAIEGGGWFDTETATVFKESTRFDGSNRVSEATGSQWKHEALYLTAKGAWIKNYWSQYQGSTETYERVSVEAAVDWLTKCGHDVAEIAKEHKRPELLEALRAQEA